MYRRILLAYDGSSDGQKALREGALLAMKCGSEVFLLSVIPDSTGMVVADAAFAGALSQQQQNYREIFDQGIARLKALGFKPSGKLVCGDPAQQIGAVAKESGAELVVVGHRKRSLVERWWSGSSGAYLIDRIECSLLISRHAISDEVFAAAVEAFKTRAQATSPT